MREKAEDALVTALSFYTDEGRPLPTPSAARGRPVAMLSAGISNVELGRQLGLDEKSVRRLRDPLHRSHIDQIEAALRLLGKRLEVRMLEAT